jgi:hypothetical protein
MLHVADQVIEEIRRLRQCGRWVTKHLAAELHGGSFQFADVEEEFLHAAEFGDVPSVRRLLQEYPELNVDCIDALGRTALRLAVKNEHLEVRTTFLILISCNFIFI